ncbi:DNA-processing protein DprA [Salinicoccus roseus]|uniref:DNA-processing protein DprA n=1 Tax=Salinicoccus roseus TaxID=45670 RepID=UPI0023008B79|nr:DNA-processing protein DprA [Salinicoccus roseus]
MKENSTRNNLLLLKQFGFSDKTLETIYTNENEVLEVIFNKYHLFHDKYFDIYTKKEKNLSRDVNRLIEFSRTFVSKMNEYKKRGIKVFYKYSEDYPHHVFTKENKPLFLYAYGKVELLNSNKKRVAIIGTRNPTETGKEETRKYVRNYTNKGWVTVSGLAKGIDTIVHIETLNQSGYTIAIVPTSFEKIYPLENKNLYYDILEREGLLLTKIGPFEDTYKTSFLERNTIVASCSHEILFIEASLHSGTLNTVRKGYELGKKIYYDSTLLDKEVISYISEKYKAIQLNN